MPCLDQRVFDKSGAGLGDFWHAMVSLRRDHPAVAQYLCKFADLALVMAGDD